MGCATEFNKTGFVPYIEQTGYIRDISANRVSEVNNFEKRGKYQAGVLK